MATDQAEKDAVILTEIDLKGKELESKFKSDIKKQSDE